MITLRNITLRRGTKIVLDDASVPLQPGEKIGLVGRNGAGKSSLFALLTDRLQSDKGEVDRPRQWAVGEVAQNMPETEIPATDYVLEGDIRLMAARKALDEAEAAEDGHAMADAHALLMGLGFKGEQVDAPVNSFSGGWRMRLQLARALMCPADLMLLDEPTNHLDLDALVWLEAWLQRYEGTLIIISHDREFLDAITKVTLHLDEAKLLRYGGNYTTFEMMRAERMEQQQAAFGKQQDRIAHLQKFIDRFKAKASKAKQAQSRVKALERMEKLAPMLASSDFSFGFKEPGQLPNPMLAIADAAFGYTGQDRTANTVLRHVNRSVLAGQRLGILGANGQGKSTLVKTIARAMQPLAGQITEGKGLVIGYFAQQELDLLRPADDPLAHMLRLAKDIGPGSREPAREQDLRNHLGRFNFSGDMVRQTVGTMSGGEKARLVLAMIVWQRPNLLLLDEPTNHLDLATREALTMALNEFEGTVLLVSHDRALLRAVCDEFWLVGRGVVAPFDGDLDDYQRYLLDEAKRLREQARLAPETSVRAEATAAPIAAPATRHTDPAATRHTAAAATQRKLDAQARPQLADKTRPLNQQLQKIAQRLALLSAERSALEQKLNQALPATEIAACGRRLKAANAETARLEERWLEISAALDEISGATVNGP